MEVGGLSCRKCLNVALLRVFLEELKKGIKFLWDCQRVGDLLKFGHFQGAFLWQVWLLVSEWRVLTPVAVKRRQLTEYDGHGYQTQCCASG